MKYIVALAVFLAFAMIIDGLRKQAFVTSDVRHTYEAPAE